MSNKTFILKGTLYSMRYTLPLNLGFLCPLCGLANNSCFIRSLGERET